MKSKIIECPTLTLMGFDFFGDPMHSHAGWTEENEIGRLWQRWMQYLMANEAALPEIQNPRVSYEVHVYHPETMQTGEFEVFTGVEITELSNVPPEVVVKQLLAGRYAIFTLIGDEINSDWVWELDVNWLSNLGVQRDTRFSIQRYDERFKGMDRISESELDVYIPLLP